MTLEIAESSGRRPCGSAATDGGAAGVRAASGSWGVAGTTLTSTMAGARGASIAAAGSERARTRAQSGNSAFLIWLSQGSRADRLGPGAKGPIPMGPLIADELSLAKVQDGTGGSQTMSRAAT